MSLLRRSPCPVPLVPAPSGPAWPDCGPACCSQVSPRPPPRAPDSPARRTPRPPTPGRTARAAPPPPPRPPRRPRPTTATPSRSSPRATSSRTTRSSSRRTPTRAARATTSARCSRGSSPSSPAPTWRSVTWRRCTGDDDGPYTGYPAFVSPPQVATALATTGYDSCSTASNHSLDDGTAGVSRTLGALDRAGIAHAGTGRSEAEAHRPAWLTAGGAKVAHLSYTYGTNDIPLPKDAPWTVRLIDEGRVVQDARAAREAGADVVVVSMHWGTEWQTAPDAQQRQLAQALTASRTGERPDIDLVIGTHAHVPQAYEKVNGTWVIYGMGDQIAGRMINYDDVHDPRGNEGTLGRFTFTPPAKPGARWEVTKAEFLPQWYDLAVNRVVDVDDAIAKGRDLTAVRDRLREVVLSRGAAKDGLVEGR
ncbi:lipoprotein [Streptomyces sp. SPB78]|nr:lipoprotein [Streptomyces sp. SPB78]